MHDTFNKSLIARPIAIEAFTNADAKHGARAGARMLEELKYVCACCGRPTKVPLAAVSEFVDNGTLLTCGSCGGVSVVGLFARRDAGANDIGPVYSDDGVLYAGGIPVALSLAKITGHKGR